MQNISQNTVSSTAAASLPPLPSALSLAPVAIGDIQGCCNALDRLLLLIDADDRERAAAHTALSGQPHTASPQDMKSPLWIAGDLVNRGPASLDTLRRLIALGDRVTAVIGNHDLHLLGVAAGVRPLKKGDTIGDILAAPDAEILLDWVRHRSLAHYENGFLMVHAGVPPQWDVATTLALARELETGLRSDQWRDFVGRLFGGEGNFWRDDLEGNARLRVISNGLTRLRFCTTDGTMEWKSNGGLESAVPGYLPWFEVPNRRTADVSMVFGHWAALGLIRRERLIGLDTGCVWGNALSAVRLAPQPQDRTLFQVSCPKPPPSLDPKFAELAN